MCSAVGHRSWLAEGASLSPKRKSGEVAISRVGPAAPQYLNSEFLLQFARFFRHGDNMAASAAGSDGGRGTSRRGSRTAPCHVPPITGGTLCTAASNAPFLSVATRGHVTISAMEAGKARGDCRALRQVKGKENAGWKSPWQTAGVLSAWAFSPPASQAALLVVCLPPTPGLGRLCQPARAPAAPNLRPRPCLRRRLTALFCISVSRLRSGTSRMCTQRERD